MAEPTKFSPDIYSVEDLLALVDAGRLALPEFQRDFVWRPPAVIDLLLSVARQWPIGSFLFLSGPQDFAAKPLEQAPPLTTAELLILDGQQRITALYQAFSDTAEDIYIIDLGVINESGELTDDAVTSMKRTRFSRLYPTTQALAEKTTAPTYIIHDDRKFFEWLSFIPEGDRGKFIDVRDEFLRGLKHYDVPVVRLPRDIPLPALAKIFETINRTGLKLSAFDLMVARLYPQGFNLANAWNSALEQHPDSLEAYDIAPIELLKLIALREYLLPLPERSQPIRGIRESDVLALRAEDVIENWDWAIETYVATLSFLKSRCGAVAAILLPPSALILSIAATLGIFEEEAGDLVEQWFWASMFGQTYAQGANTQAITDARLLAMAVREKERPEALHRFTVDSEAFLDARRRNEILLRAVLCLTVQRGARDWGEDGTPIATSGKQLVLHRIFPSNYLADRGQNPELVLNFTVLERDTSILIGKKTPGEAIVEGLIRPEHIRTHFIDPAALETNDIPTFVDSRFRNLVDASLDAVSWA